MIRGRITYVSPPDTLIRDIRKGLKNGLQQTVDYWHTNILPGHFDRSAHAKYGYKSRNQKYIIRKLRKTGQANDLVYTGKLKRAALRSIRLSGTSKRASGTLDVPKYAYQYRKYSGKNQPDKAAELTAITLDEAETLAHELDKTLQQTFDGNRETRTV